MADQDFIQGFKHAMTLEEVEGNSWLLLSMGGLSSPIPHAPAHYSNYYGQSNQDGDDIEVKSQDAN